MSDVLRLTGAQFTACHGLLPTERRTPQTFLVDVAVWLDLTRAAESRDLATTIDYRDMWRAAHAVMEGPSEDLLETLAHRIVQRLLVPPAERVVVLVRKLNPPLASRCESVSVEIDRSLSP